MVEFIVDTHQYLVDGILVPSVSTILGATIFKDKYNSVPSDVLAKAAHFGTQVHLAIETSEWLHLSDEEFIVYERWLKLKKQEQITPIEHEQVVNHGYDYAGTFDMIADIKSERCLVDIKTTYNLDREYLSWQLSMYELAKGERFDKLYVIWLPKRKGAELVEIERKSEDEIKGLVRGYYDSRR